MQPMTPNPVKPIRRPDFGSFFRFLAVALLILNAGAYVAFSVQAADTAKASKARGVGIKVLACRILVDLKDPLGTSPSCAVTKETSVVAR